MLILSKKIIGLRVETVSGNFLGHIKEFVIDNENIFVTTFYIRPHGIVKGLVGEDLKISKTQVVSLNENKMVVDDSSEIIKERSEKYNDDVIVEGSPISASIIE